MKLPAEIFRTYDIRGIVGRTLTAPIVRDIGRALGSLARERGSFGREFSAPTFAVCRDGRLSGPELLAALSDGLQAAGADVIDVGMAPTPIAYFAAVHLNCGSCVAVSGSHNPPDYNGLKMVVAGDTLYGDDIQALRTRIERSDFKSGSGKRRETEVLSAYFGGRVYRTFKNGKCSELDMRILSGFSKRPHYLFRKVLLDLFFFISRHGNLN